mmetsp:Transcript_16575/g.30094  ORF Transcript_16575/g.30094 Transcript_16575/m.30094 type:complete len:143 (+) Transcript_16575:314-742(+)|eukprot:CAMPEP_0201865680 /NCGR_PEP_ID=MMETSP0902-20130614/497_1 /ASSEMBLY_ACC=CAM_ASM_000551 /TAXON_ID=420261 /ORGANISM="Thalassiosira antarctica, Strain CCMP982" /LENGTH=142 /DNA_ID=CAMNT_0048390495 /DNA_START=307 /DNA_END=735 /DNA_ORIENTATION=+
MINNNMLSDVTTHLKSILKYLHKNAWTIVFIIAGGYFCYSEIIDPLLHKYRTARSYKQATDPNRVAVLSPDMRRVRARQQERAMEDSIEVAEERKKKLVSERERKRVKSPEEKRWEKLGGEGTQLGDVVGSEEGGDGLRRRR